VEEQPQAPVMQTFSRQHTSGEVFEAQNIEMAHDMCPVLGAMSVEEAGLLLELEAIGMQQMAENPNIEHVETAIAPDTQQAPNNSSDDLMREALFANMHYNFLFDEEAPKVVNPVKAGVTEEPATEAVLKKSPRLTVVQEAKPEITSARALEPIAKVISTAATLPGTIETISRTLKPEPELASIRILKTPESIKAQEELSGYNFIEPDDVILPKTKVEQKIIGPDEGEELPLTEVGAVLDETEVPEFIPAETQAVISLPELPSTVKELEDAITLVSEALELTETDVSKRVYQIVEEIIALPAKLETGSDGAASVIEERLEELFIELFVAADIEYTPELITSFIKLTQAHYLEELLETAKDSDSQALPDEVGTREFLQRLQHSLSNMKQAVIHLYEIGKSALLLYGLDRTALVLNA
jgi:hypothetical protein